VPKWETEAFCQRSCNIINDTVETSRKITWVNRSGYCNLRSPCRQPDFCRCDVEAFGEFCRNWLANYFLAQYSKKIDKFQGYRTLCIAKVDIQPDFYEKWQKTFYEASIAVQDRERKVADAAELIERVSLTMFQAYYLISRKNFELIHLLIVIRRCFRTSFYLARLLLKINCKKLVFVFQIYHIYLSKIIENFFDPVYFETRFSTLSNNYYRGYRIPLPVY